VHQPTRALRVSVSRCFESLIIEFNMKHKRFFTASVFLLLAFVGWESSEVRARLGRAKGARRTRRNRICKDCAAILDSILSMRQAPRLRWAIPGRCAPVHPRPRPRPRPA